MTTAHAQPALPGMTTAAADASHSAARFAQCWSEAEKDFAIRCIDTWNSAFTNHGTRANHTRHNHWLCARLLRWINSPNNTGECMTAQDVFIAIRAYAADPWIREKCAGRWLAFPDWMNQAAEKHVDKQLARIGKRRGATAVTPAQKARSESFTKAMKFISARGWDELAKSAARETATLREFLQTRRTLAARYTGRRGADECRRLDDMMRMVDAVTTLMGENREAWRNIHNYSLAALKPMRDELLKRNIHVALMAEFLHRFGQDRAAMIAKAIWTNMEAAHVRKE